MLPLEILRPLYIRKATFCIEDGPEFMGYTNGEHRTAGRCPTSPGALLKKS